MSADKHTLHTAHNILQLTSSSPRLHPCTAFWSHPGSRWAGWMSRGQSQDMSHPHAHQLWCWLYADHHCWQSSKTVHINISPWKLSQVIPPPQSSFIELHTHLKFPEKETTATHPCRAFSPKKSPFWRVRMYFSSSVLGCFIVTFTCNTGQGLNITSSITFQWHNLCGCYTTHLSFADDEECISSSTLPNDVITRCIECL